MKKPWRSPAVKFPDAVHAEVRDDPGPAVDAIGVHGGLGLALGLQVPEPAAHQLGHGDRAPVTLSVDLKLPQSFLGVFRLPWTVLASWVTLPVMGVSSREGPHQEGVGPARSDPAVTRMMRCVGL